MDPFIGEIRVFALTFTPAGWAPCDGRLLSIAQNQALFAILGPTYGGDGRTNFALPNLNGRAPMGTGSGPGLTPRKLGESGGEAAVTLKPDQAQHSHLINVSSQPATSSDPADNVFAASPKSYAPVGKTAPNNSVIAPTGGGQPHNNMQPYLPLNYCIALTGIFPPRS